MKLWTRPALKRLLVLAFLIAGVVIGCWLTMIRMPLASYRGPWIPLNPEEIRARDRLKGHVVKLATEIGERNVFVPGKLREAASYIEETLKASAYATQSQTYTVEGESCRNIEAELKGTAKPDQIIVVGAHYDSVTGCPGANDNGTGVAALLELARGFAGRPQSRTIRFVAFVNEEPPFFQTDRMGSLRYARACRERGDDIRAMLSIETIGYYSDARGSQKYPFPLGLVYPSQGNFIAFVGDVANRGLVRRAIESFRRQARFPSEGGALPSGLPGIAWSDHWSFWQAGYPAIMVTDTAPFRYAQYHTEDDTADRVDFDRMTRVVEGLSQVIDDLATEPN